MDIMEDYESKTCLGITQFVLENTNEAKGQTGGKNRSSIFVLTAFNRFGRFNIFPLVGDGSLWPR